MTESDSQNRIHPRSNLLLKVRYGNASEFLSDYTANLSASGVFIETDETFDTGQPIEFEVSFPGLLQPISLRGVVKWCRTEADAGGPAGVGVQFLQEQTSPDGPLARLIAHGQRAALPPTAESASGQFRVLLAEDNIVIRDMFRYGVQKLAQRTAVSGTKIEVVEAENGKQAWDLLQSQRIDLLVLDLYMPIMTGTQLIEQVRNDPRLNQLPVIVISSAGLDDRKLALEAGADIFLSKPIKLKDMIETIETLISSGHHVAQQTKLPPLEGGE